MATVNVDTLLRGTTLELREFKRRDGRRISNLNKVSTSSSLLVALRAVPNQDENPLISRNKGFTSGFWGLISEDKEGLGPHPSLS